MSLRALLAASLLAGSLSVALPTAPHAQEILLDQADIIGSGDSLTLTRVPVQIGNRVVYRDVTITLDATSAGRLSVARTVVRNSSNGPTGSNFRAGRYVAPATILSGRGIVEVESAAVGQGGRRTWFLRTPDDADECTYPSSASWTTGPIAGHPLEDLLVEAGVPDGFYSYGQAQAFSFCGAPGAFEGSRLLIGVRQVGRSLTISSFTDNSGEEGSTPQAQIIYTLRGAP